MSSPYISAETSASFFFSFKIYEMTARKQKRCLGANLGHDFPPKIIPRDISAIHHRNTSARPRRGADMSCWHCACNLLGFSVAQAFYSVFMPIIMYEFALHLMVNSPKIPTVGLYRHGHNNTNISESLTSLFV